MFLDPLVRGGRFKNLGERKRREKKAKAACKVSGLEVEELKWEEYLPLADGEQLDTQGGTCTHSNPETKMDILTHKHTNMHALRTTIPAGYELQCRCCHGDTLSC